MIKNIKKILKETKNEKSRFEKISDILGENRITFVAGFFIGYVSASSTVIGIIYFPDKVFIATAYIVIMLLFINFTMLRKR